MRVLKGAGYRSDHDTYLGARYKRAGFAILGKTNLPELALTPFTEPDAYGPTRNPWDLERSPRGSSGGSAAAVAAGPDPPAPGPIAGRRSPGDSSGEDRACSARYRAWAYPNRSKEVRTMIDTNGYRLQDPDAIETPAMLVYRERVEHNLATLCDLAGGGGNLMVHVKTHKSLEVTRRQLAAGVAGFKTATLKELEMVLQAGAELALLAYPQVQLAKLERFADLCERYPEAAIYTLVSKPLHLERLAAVAARRGRPLGALLDLDVGMARTGIAPGPEAEALYRAMDESDHVVAGGLHAYDGHDHEPDPVKREALAVAHIEQVKRFRDLARGHGWPVDLIVGGGSFSFPYYAREDGMHGSPGTNVYWDHGYACLMPDMPFEWAAFILTQVVDVYPERGYFTTDLGSKAVASDKDLGQRAHLPALPDARLVGQSEEHGVFALPGALPEVGSYLLAVPGHVCPTTIRYPHSLWVDGDGRVTGINEHSARDRL